MSITQWNSSCPERVIGISGQEFHGVVNHFIDKKGPATTNKIQN
jgi:hypothetical protein